MRTDEAGAWRSRIVVDHDVLSGRAVIAGTRVPVYVIVGSLAGGMSEDEVCREYAISIEDVRAALAYAADTIADEAVVVAR